MDDVIVADYEVLDDYGGDLKGGTEARRYRDGSIRNERGYMLKPLPGKHTITKADASALANKLHEKKRMVIAEAANKAVERGDLRLQYGSMAYVAEIADAMQKKATNIDDPKMVDAARFLIQETGLGEKETARADNAVETLAALGAEMVKYIMGRAQSRDNA